MHETNHTERALLVVIKERKEPLSQSELGAEFKSLVLSTGIEVVQIVSANLHIPTAAFYIGKGKVEELRAIAADTGVNAVIFNNNLSFSQQRNLENVFQVKTLDRTQLILDIFAKHARSQEGMLQLEYLMPRLRGKGIMLSRLGGGIGTRGPGEKKLEVDRRRIAEKILRLKSDLENVKQHHEVMRKKRGKSTMSMCSLVGYTNAGKTTLFNTLAQDTQQASSAMFTTLDTVSRIFPIDSKTEALLSDTVGFIYKLPPHLIEAFKTTLDELNYADILLHIIDASSSNVLHYKKAVDSILTNLGLDDKPLITVFNKIDLLESQELTHLKNDYPQSVFISATQGTGIDELLRHIHSALFKDRVEVVVKVPFERMKAVDYFHRNAEVLKTAYHEKNAVFWLRLTHEEATHLKRQGFEVKEI